MNFEINLPYDITIEDFLIVMSALSAGVVTIAIWFSLLHKDSAAKRANILAEQRAAMRISVLERFPIICGHSRQQRSSFRIPLV